MPSLTQPPKAALLAAIEWAREHKLTRGPLNPCDDFFFTNIPCPNCEAFASFPDKADCPTCHGSGGQSAAEGVLALFTAGMRLLEYANQQSVMEKVSANSLFDNLTSWLELCEKESAEAATKAERLQNILDRSRPHRQKTLAVVSELMELAYQLVPGPIVKDGDHALKLIKSSWHRIQRERVYQKARAEAAEAELAECGENLGRAINARNKAEAERDALQAELLHKEGECITLKGDVAELRCKLREAETSKAERDALQAGRDALQAEVWRLRGLVRDASHECWNTSHDLTVESHWVPFEDYWPDSQAAKDLAEAVKYG